MAEYNRGMQLMQEIQKLERAHNYFTARTLVQELPATQEVKQVLIEWINRNEARQNGQAAV